MKSKDLHESIKKIKVDELTKEGLLEIIDLKTDSDMNTFAEKLDKTESTFSEKFESLKNEINTLKWIIGIGIAIITVLLGIIALK